MKTEIISTRIDQDTKLAFTQICDEIGLNTSQAIQMFARAVINHGGIPFELRVRQPNAVTAEAIQEVIDGKGKPERSVAALLEELTQGRIKDANAGNLDAV